jgi:hypothetical protein
VPNYFSRLPEVDILYSDTKQPLIKGREAAEKGHLSSQMAQLASRGLSKAQSSTLFPFYPG